MPVVTSTNTITLAVNEQGAIGIGPATATVAAAALQLKSQFSVSGTGADQLALVYAKTLTFAASTPQTLNLQSLVDPLGNAISFSQVRFIAYRIQSSNPAYVILNGGAASNQWTGRLNSGGIETWFPSSAANDGFSIIQAPSATGIPVTSSSCDMKLDPGANAVGAVDLVIAGS